MHNNGLIKFFAFCFTLVSVYQISFTFITSNVEDKASQYSINAISDSNENYADLLDFRKYCKLKSIKFLYIILAES